MLHPRCLRANTMSVATCGVLASFLSSSCVDIRLSLVTQTRRFSARSRKVRLSSSRQNGTTSRRVPKTLSHKCSRLIHLYDRLRSPYCQARGCVSKAPRRLHQLARTLSHDYKVSVRTRLKKVALTAVAQQLPDSEIEALQNIFRSLDKNGDGMLSPDEVTEGLKQQGLVVPKAMEGILKSIDCNGSGQLDYTEFVAATIDQKVYMQRDVCWAAFRTFDLDGDGKITREELATVLNGGNVQEALGSNKIEKIIAEVDSNGDGCIDFEEFCAMMMPKGKRKSFGGESSVQKRSRISDASAPSGVS